MNHEQLESLLRQAAASNEATVPVPAGLTTRVHRRRQRNAGRRRRRAFAAVLAGGYLAGLATSWLWNAVPDATGPREIMTQSQPADAAAAQNTAGRSAAERSPAVAGVASPGSEHLVPFPRETPYEQLRRLGDEYLQVRGDVATALVFYRRALEEGSPDEIAVSDGHESWLLNSLKRDHRTSSTQNVTGEAI